MVTMVTGRRTGSTDDVPLTQVLEPMFYQEHSQRQEKIDRVVMSSPYRFARAEIARQLDQAQADPEGFRGARITLAAPDIAGAKTRRYRTTANTVFHVMEGSGETAIGDKTVIEPRKAIKHLVFATLRPDFARHFTFDAGDVIKLSQ